jgi:chromosome segregation ATPase
MKADDSIARVLDKLDDISQDIKVLRNDAQSTKTDVAMLNVRMRSLEDRVKATQTDTSDIKTDIRRLEVLHEETDTTIEQISEAIVPTLEQTTELKQAVESHSDKLAFLDQRLQLLEKKAV